MRSKRLAPSVLLVLLAALLPPPPGLAAEEPSEPSPESARQQAHRELHRIFDDAWEEALRRNPLFATNMGDHRFNDRLPEVSKARVEEDLAFARKLAARLDAVDRSVLDRQDQISYDMFRVGLEEGEAEYRFRRFLMPIQPQGGFHTGFVQLPERVPLATVRDYENYIARLAAFDTYARQHIALMRKGIEEGRVLPRLVLTGVEDQISPHVVEAPEDSLLYAPFESFPEGFSEAERERLRAAGRKALTESVIPAYRELLAFMTDEYVPASRDEVGVWALPDGEEYYAYAIRHHTTLDLGAEEIHQIGLSEVARIRAEMEEIIDEVGFEGSFDAFLEHLRTDPRFYPKTPEELLSKAAWIAKKMDGELPKLFKTLPRVPYGIKAVPDYLAPKIYPGYYQPPAGDGSRAGFYYVNTYNLPSRPLYEYEALTLHEAVPGHHLENALNMELGELPRFRQFGGVTAFGEGWALYAERLGLEVGFYEDPYSNFGRLTYEMWRACRLVVDTGIHAFRWDRQKAIDYMAANSALALHNITTEVDRYISWPGQALAYKLGELKIRELRARAEEELGDAFDIREFHDAVLANGAVPLPVLEESIDLFIAGQKEQHSDRRAAFR